ncbi:MAG: EamA family transporter [Alistipes sp.]|nr:EamA family transporter [Alistipes sp.]
MKSHNILWSHLALLGCNIVWACDYPFYNLLLGKYIAPAAMVSASLIVAAALSWVPLFWSKHEKIERKDWGIIIFAALLMGLVRKTMMMFGLSRTSPIDGSIIATITPLLVLILSVIAGTERFTLRKLLGMILGMAGAIAVILTSTTPQHHHSEIWGNLMMICSCTVTALYMVFFKRLVAKYRITTLLRAIYTISAIVALPFGIKPIATTEFTTFNPHILLAAAFVLVVPTYLPNMLLNYSLRFVPPTTTSIYAYIQPLLAITLSVVMGLDHLHIDTILFAIVLFTGVGLVVSEKSAQEYA